MKPTAAEDFCDERYSARHIFLTGIPGCGKTTVITKVLKMILGSQILNPSDICGFYTEEVRDNRTKERTGFDVVVAAPQESYTSSCQMSPARARLAGVGSLLPKVGKYSVDVKSFESVALPQLKAAKDNNTRLVIIDEFGKMEMQSEKFKCLVHEILDMWPKAIILGTIPVPRYGRDIDDVRQLKEKPGILVKTISKSTRDTDANLVFEEVCGMLENVAKITLDT